MRTYYIGWWNVKNLFDTSSSATRPDWLKSNLKSELKGWTSTVLGKKAGNHLPAQLGGKQHSEPVRFGRPSSGYNPNGYSDHLPLTLRITEH